jgi:hypothetical protein
VELSQHEVNVETGRGPTHNTKYFENGSGLKYFVEVSVRKE